MKPEYIHFIFLLIALKYFSIKTLKKEKEDILKRFET